MPRMVFAPFRIRVPQQYIIGEESPGLKVFRSILPPFIHFEVVGEGTPEYEDLKAHSVTFEAGDNFVAHVIEYMSRRRQRNEECRLRTVSQKARLSDGCSHPGVASPGRRRLARIL